MSASASGARKAASSGVDSLGGQAEPGPAPGAIYGIGTDICEIPRIEAALARHGERFALKVLGPGEVEVFRARLVRARKRGVNYLATRFAAKEAFAKAIGLGLRMPMTWRACETLNAPSGQPQIRLHGQLADWFAARRLLAHVTVTDESAYAAAFVVVERLPDLSLPLP